MRVGFTGSRHGIGRDRVLPLLKLLDSLKPSELHHGDCVGADQDAHVLACDLKIPIVIHPPVSNQYRARMQYGDPTILPPKPYLARNHDIVDAVEVLVACPREATEVQRSGTWATVRYARKRGVPVKLIYPRGEIKCE